MIGLDELKQFSDFVAEKGIKVSFVMMEKDARLSAQEYDEARGVIVNPRIAELEAQVSDMVGVLDSLKAQHASLTGEYARVSKELMEERQNNALAGDAASKANARVQALEADNKRLVSEAAKLSEELAGANKSVSTVSDELNVEIQKTAELASRVNSLLTEVAARDKSCAEFEVKLKDCMEFGSRMAEDNHRLAEECAALRATPPSTPTVAVTSDTAAAIQVPQAIADNHLDLSIDVLGFDVVKATKYKKKGWKTIGELSNALTSGGAKAAGLKKDDLVEIGMRLLGATAPVAPREAGVVVTNHPERPWEERLAAARRKEASTKEWQKKLDDLNKRLTESKSDEEKALLKKELEDAQDGFDIFQCQLLAMLFCMGLDHTAGSVDAALRAAGASAFIDEGDASPEEAT